MNVVNFVVVEFMTCFLAKFYHFIAINFIIEVSHHSTKLADVS